MVVERDEFFAELDGLTEKEIEARLDLWDQEQLALIQEYLDQRVLGRAKAEQAAQIKAGPNAQDVAVASLVEVASTANTKATAALILSVGAMLAAMASALVAFLALRVGRSPGDRLVPGPLNTPSCLILGEKLLANLHVSDDGRCAVKYAQWQSKTDFEKAMQVPEFQAHMKQVKDLIESFDPVLTNFVIARADLRFEASALLLVVATLGSKLRPRRAGSPSITGRLSSITWQ